MKFLPILDILAIIGLIWAAVRHASRTVLRHVFFAFLAGILLAQLLVHDLTYPIGIQPGGHEVNVVGSGGTKLVSQPILPPWAVTGCLLLLTAFAWWTITRRGSRPAPEKKPEGDDPKEGD